MSKVIVIGGGLAGLSAAHTILENGGSVLLLDKSAFWGGNSTKATSGINGKFLCFEEISRYFCGFFLCFARASIGSIFLFVSLSFLSFFPKQRRAMMMICALSARTLFSLSLSLSLRKERERDTILYKKARALPFSLREKFRFVTEI